MCLCVCQAPASVRWRHSRDAAFGIFLPLLPGKNKPPKPERETFLPQILARFFGKGITSKAIDYLNSSTTRIFVPKLQFGLWQHLAEAVPVGKRGCKAPWLWERWARNQQGLKDCPSLHPSPPDTAVGQAHTAEPVLKGRKEKEDFTINIRKTGKRIFAFSDSEFQG